MFSFLFNQTRVLSVDHNCSDHHWMLSIKSTIDKQIRFAKELLHEMQNEQDVELAKITELKVVLFVLENARKMVLKKFVLTLSDQI